MVRPIIKDAALLSLPCKPASGNDYNVMLDLIDTFRANKNTLSGMAANMIGFNKSIIIFDTGVQEVVMINPVIKKQSESYIAEEKCPCYDEAKRTTRYKKIKVQFYDPAFHEHTRTYTGTIAQIIQHEIDHCEGVAI